MVDIDENQKLVSNQKVKTMKFAFNVITIVLLIGFISSLFIPPQKRKPKPTVGVTTHI